MTGDQGGGEVKRQELVKFVMVGDRTVSKTCLIHGWRNDFKGGGWDQIFEVKNGVSAPIKNRRDSGDCYACVTQGVSERGVPPEVASFFENIVLDEAIWCTIFIMLNT